MVEHMEMVKEGLTGNMGSLDGVMRENNAISEDNSATFLPRRIFLP